MIYLLHHALEQSAERYPDHEVMRFANQSLTYAELSRRSNNLAHTLIDQGVQRRDRVGVFLNKSLETAVAIYGIMKAGAAYVPLDPLAPPSRLALAMRDCGVRHLVTAPNKRDALTAITAETPDLEAIIGVAPGDDLTPRCLSWGEVWDEVNTLNETAPPNRQIMEQDLAYIMYTSGSTGRPKGIMHTHYSGLSYARMSVATYGVTHEDRLSNHSPLHFDMSTFDYLSGPLAGATTVIIPEPYAKLPASLSQLIEAERLTIWYSVPFALIQLLLRGALDKRDLSSLRWIMFGGEPFPPKHLRALMELLPGARFSNVYGPAEVNQCTYYHLPPVAEIDDTPIPIGQIWDNAEGLILGEDDQQVPPGESGELVVRTPTMMRGYWGRPDLNARAFFRRPVFADYDDVFYRTGDLVQTQADGTLAFLGRKDRQVKVRGYRVELDEVENALSGHAQVEEGAVYAIPDEEGGARIGAAVILRADAGVDAAAVIAYLQDHLPGYAVPAHIDIVSEFPRTTSGKIDRNALQTRAVAAAD
ncbi:MAG: amino acid adenylation domain-containing protein [Chloroflexi bacterium]|nr:amino acid adenylation domain-containing protein [Chloroflexota bacterium]